MKIKRIFIILFISIILLIVPFIAMQFTKEINWSIGDFTIAGVVIFGTGLLIEFALRKVKSTLQRIVVIAILALFFLLVWTELAVGIF